jgi:hypothetical protein
MEQFRRAAENEELGQTKGEIARREANQATIGKRLGILAQKKGLP